MGKGPRFTVSWGTYSGLETAAEGSAAGTTEQRGANKLDEGDEVQKGGSGGGARGSEKILRIGEDRGKDTARSSDGTWRSEGSSSGEDRPQGKSFNARDDWKIDQEASRRPLPRRGSSPSSGKGNSLKTLFSSLFTASALSLSRSFSLSIFVSFCDLLRSITLTGAGRGLPSPDLFVGRRGDTPRNSDHRERERERVRFCRAKIFTGLLTRGRERERFLWTKAFTRCSYQT